MLIHVHVLVLDIFLITIPLLLAFSRISQGKFIMLPHIPVHTTNLTCWCAIILVFNVCEHLSTTLHRTFSFYYYSTAYAHSSVLVQILSMYCTVYATRNTCTAHCLLWIVLVLLYLQHVARLLKCRWLYSVLVIKTVSQSVSLNQLSTHFINIIHYYCKIIFIHTLHTCTV